MNLHKLEIFCTVVQRRSITAAADKFRLTQPAVSLQIKALEKEFGLPLFERGQRQMRLTQAGEALHRCAVSILHAKDEAQRVIDELSAATKGRLILGANVTGGMYVLPRIVHAFKERHPGAEIIFEIDSTARLCESALQSALDMALVSGPVQDKRLRVDQVCQDCVVLIVAPSHPFARRSAVLIRDLKPEPCILPGEGSRTRALVERRLKAAGVTLRVVMQLGSTEAVKKAVEAGLGIGFVSGHAVEREVRLGALKMVPVQRLEINRHFELIYRRHKYFSPLAERFREFACSFGQQIPPVRAESPPAQALPPPRPHGRAGAQGSYRASRT